MTTKHRDDDAARRGDAGLAPGQATLRLVLAPNPSPMTFRGTNTWIVGRGRVAVIDPGPADPVHLAAIQAALDPGETISHIFVTHAHADHSGLARPLADASRAPILAFGTAGDGLRALPEGFPDEPAKGGEGIDRSFAPDQTLRDGDRVEAETWHLQAIHTPGHLGNHLCLAWGGQCFTGDHVMGWASSIVSPPEGHMGDYRRSLAQTATQRWSRFLPGHGDPIPRPAARLAALLAHRQGREDEILDALATGAITVRDITTRIYTETPPALLPAAARNVLAHLIELTETGRVEADHGPAGPPRFRLT